MHTLDWDLLDQSPLEFLENFPQGSILHYIWEWKSQFKKSHWNNYIPDLEKITGAVL